MTKFTLKTLCGAKKNTRYISLFFLTGFILSFTTCQDMEMEMSMRSLEADNQIEFKTTPQTRSAENLLFEVGDTIGIYSVIWEPGNQIPGELQSSGNYDDNKPYILVDENDNWTSPDPIYYPFGKRKIDLYAYYPWNDIPMNNNTTLNVSVHEDQSALDNYQRSDFKAAVTRGLNKDSGPFHFDFYHRLSQLSFEIVAGTGVRPEEILGAQIKLKNVITNGSYSFTDGEPDIVTPGNQISDITPCGILQLEGNKLTGKSAIVIPQTLTSETILELTVEEEIVTADFAENVTLRSGESRLITITLNADGIDFTTEIKPWDEQPPTEE